MPTATTSDFDARASLEPDDYDLLDPLRAGDPVALESIIQRYRKPLLAFADRLLSGKGEPEDIVQEAFARFWVNRKRLRDDGSIRALLYCTVRTLAVDEQRRWKRRHRCRVRGSCLPSNDTPLDQLLGSELRRMAEKAIHELPPRRQAIFRLVREEGLSHREAARSLGLSTQTVSNTMSAALAEIRSCLQPILDEAG